MAAQIRSCRSYPDDLGYEFERRDRTGHRNPARQEPADRNVSSVPRVRQLTALRTDLVCVSAPRNKTTRYASYLTEERTYQAGALSHPPDVFASTNHQWTRPANACILQKNLTNALI